MAKTETVFITRYDLSSLFEKSLKLLGPVLKPTILPGLAVFIPVGVIVLAFFRVVFASAQALSSAETASDVLAWSGSMIGLALLLGLVGGLGGAAVMMIASRATFRAATKDPAGTADLLRESLRGKVGRLILFILLVGAASLGLTLAVAAIMALIGIVIASLGDGAASAAIVLMTALGILLVYPALFILNYILALGFPILANEDTSAAGAFTRCFKLSKGRLLRVAGSSFLFALALSTVLGIASTPLFLATFIPFIVQAASISGSQAATDVAMASLMSAVAWPYAFLVLAYGLGQAIVNPIFTTLLYVDLRVRSGELPDAAEFSDLSVDTTGLPS
jgi:hypothetical protein